jgi:hypothetical protein
VKSEISKSIVKSRKSQLSGRAPQEKRDDLLDDLLDFDLNLGIPSTSKTPKTPANTPVKIPQNVVSIFTCKDDSQCPNDFSCDNGNCVKSEISKSIVKSRKSQLSGRRPQEKEILSAKETKLIQASQDIKESDENAEQLQQDVMDEIQESENFQQQIDQTVTSPEHQKKLDSISEQSEKTSENLIQVSNEIDELKNNTAVEINQARKEGDFNQIKEISKDFEKSVKQIQQRFRKIMQKKQGNEIKMDKLIQQSNVYSPPKSDASPEYSPDFHSELSSPAKSAATTPGLDVSPAYSPDPHHETSPAETVDELSPSLIKNEAEKLQKKYRAKKMLGQLKSQKQQKCLGTLSVKDFDKMGCKNLRDDNLQNHRKKLLAMKISEHSSALEACGNAKTIDEWDGLNCDKYDSDDELLESLDLDSKRYKEYKQDLINAKKKDCKKSNTIIDWHRLDCDQLLPDDPYKKKLEEEKRSKVLSKKGVTLGQKVFGEKLSKVRQKIKDRNKEEEEEKQYRKNVNENAKYFCSEDHLNSDFGKIYKQECAKYKKDYKKKDKRLKTCKEIMDKYGPDNKGYQMCVDKLEKYKEGCTAVPSKEMCTNDHYASTCYWDKTQESCFGREDLYKPKTISRKLLDKGEQKDKRNDNQNVQKIQQAYRRFKDKKSKKLKDDNARKIQQAIRRSIELRKQKPKTSVKTSEASPQNAVAIFKCNEHSDCPDDFSCDKGNCVRSFDESFEGPLVGRTGEIENEPSTPSTPSTQYHTPQATAASSTAASSTAASSTVSTPYATPTPPEPDCTGKSKKKCRNGCTWDEKLTGPKGQKGACIRRVVN